MSIGVEHMILILTTFAGVLKAYFEAQKAKAESARADNQEERAGEAEELLKVAVNGVEEAKKQNPELGKQIKKYTQSLGVDDKFHAIVKEITEGEGNVHRATTALSKEKLRKMLENQ